MNELLQRLSEPFNWLGSDSFAATTFRRVAGVAALLAVVVGLLVAVQKYPEQQVRWAHVHSNGMPPEKAITPADVASAENEFRKTFIQVVGGVFAVVALYLTWRRVRVTEQGHITDRYTKAIEQLGALTADGKPNIEVRLGAIYALERIALDSRRDHWTIMEVLTAYVRQNAPAPTAENPREGFAKGPSTEVQAILTVLGRRRRGAWREKVLQRLDLRGTDLRRIDLYLAHFERAMFDESNLQSSRFHSVHLERARLERCRLQGASFLRAHAQGASFFRSHLEETSFRKAHAEGTSFYEAHLGNATFLLAHAEGADFHGAHLQLANFARAHVEGAMFVNAHLEGAGFERAHLEGAVFGGAHLEGASFDSAYLQGARFGFAHVDGADFCGTFVNGARFDSVLGLNAEQIKDASGWERAVYDDEFAAELGLSKADGQVGDTPAS